MSQFVAWLHRKKGHRQAISRPAFSLWGAAAVPILRLLVREGVAVMTYIYTAADVARFGAGIDILRQLNEKKEPEMIEATDQGRWLVSVPSTPNVSYDAVTVPNRADAERISELFASIGDVQVATSYDKTAH